MVRLDRMKRVLAVDPQAGLAKVEADGATLRAVIDDLVARHPGLADQLLDDGGLRGFVNVFVDDEDVRYLDGFDTPVGDGAEVAILPAVAGGAPTSETTMSVGAMARRSLASARRCSSTRSPLRSASTRPTCGCASWSSPAA